MIATLNPYPILNRVILSSNLPDKLTTLVDRAFEEVSISKTENLTLAEISLILGQFEKLTRLLIGPKKASTIVSLLQQQLTLTPQPEQDQLENYLLELTGIANQIKYG